MSTDTIRVLCSDCGSKINAPAKMAGKIASCPKCKATLTIPRAEAPTDEPDEYPFDVAPPDPPFVPPVPVFAREDEEEEEADTPPRTEKSRDASAAVFNPLFPNLSRYLSFLQTLVVIFCVLMMLFGSVNALVVAVSSQGDGVGLFLAVAIVTVTVVVAAFLYMFVMAGIELIRVFLQIESNTRELLQQRDRT